MLPRSLRCDAQKARISGRDDSGRGGWRSQGRSCGRVDLWLPTCEAKLSLLNLIWWECGLLRRLWRGSAGGVDGAWRGGVYNLGPWLN
jgi:hypothetical protein